METAPSIAQRARAIAEQTADAYSADRYTSWKQVAETLLLDLGMTDAQAEAFMRSKHTRWAADGSDAPHGKAPATRTILKYVRSKRNFPNGLAAELTELVRGN